MLQEVQPFQTLFIGTIAFFIALQWAIGIKRAREGNWSVLGSAVVLSAAMMLIVFGFKDDDRFLPPKTTVGTWSVVGLIFVVTFLMNLIILPFLSRHVGPQTVSTVSVVLVFFLFGAALYWLGRSNAEDLNGQSRASAIFAAYVLWGVAVIGGVRGLYSWARGAR